MDEIYKQKRELSEQWRNEGINERIIQAFLATPRELFVPPEYKREAYLDTALPTIQGQTISQPSTIVTMLHILDIRKEHKVLEIGTGTGYQAALMSHIVKNEGKVISIEIIPELVKEARKNMKKLHITNVTILEKDGNEGHKEEAPYDRIILAAACQEIPPKLIKQLKEEGIIVAPIGQKTQQTLVKGAKRGEKINYEYFGSYQFVPLVKKQIVK